MIEGGREEGGGGGEWQGRESEGGSGREGRRAEDTRVNRQQDTHRGLGRSKRISVSVQ